MKKVIYFITYLAILAAGIFLLIFSSQAALENQPSLRALIVAGGIIFVVPGLAQLIANLRPYRNKYGVIVPRPWYGTAMGIAALIWGVFMLCMPGGFLGNLNITLGVSLILASLAQITFIIKGRKTNGAPLWLYIIPLLTICTGVITLLLKEDFQNPGHDKVVGCIITGLSLIVLAVNGFLALPRRKFTAEELAEKSKKIAEKEAKESAKEEAKEAESAKAIKDAYDAHVAAEKKAEPSGVAPEPPAEEKKSQPTEDAK